MKTIKCDICHKECSINELRKYNVTNACRSCFRKLNSIDSKDAYAKTTTKDNYKDDSQKHSERGRSTNTKARDNYKNDSQEHFERGNSKDTSDQSNHQEQADNKEQSTNTIRCADCRRESDFSKMQKIEGQYVCESCLLTKDPSRQSEIKSAKLIQRIIAVGIDFAFLGFASHYYYAEVHGDTIFHPYNLFDRWLDLSVDMRLFGWLQFFYFTITVGLFGSTLGKTIMRIKVVNLNGTRLGIRKAAIRYIVFTLEWAFFWFGFLFLLWDKKHGRALHDLICGTRVTPINSQDKKDNLFS